MHYLDFLLLDWFFWPIDCVLFYFVYLCVKPSTSRNSWTDLSPGGLFLVTVLLAVAWFHWRPSLTLALLYRTLALGAAYFAVGFLVSLYKYWCVLVAFKDASPLLLEKKKYTSAYDLCEDLELPFGCVETNDDKTSFWIDWKCLPITLWWTYWPCFSLSLVLDFIQVRIDWFIKQVRYLYESMSHRYVVQVSHAQPQKRK